MKNFLNLVTATFAGLTAAAATAYLTSSILIKQGHGESEAAAVVCLALSGAVGFVGFLFTFFACDILTDTDEV